MVISPISALNKLSGARDLSIAKGQTKYTSLFLQVQLSYVVRAETYALSQFLFMFSIEC